MLLKQTITKASSVSAHSETKTTDGNATYDVKMGLPTYFDSFSGVIWNRSWSSTSCALSLLEHVVSPALETRSPVSFRYFQPLPAPFSETLFPHTLLRLSSFRVSHTPVNARIPSDRAKGRESFRDIVRTNKKYARQIHGYIHVIVDKRAILRGI
ncbi:hypothetical protein PsorP6_001527 [Peronosclerospora sorghi]|uniref:Uncharacterized protein n=1 Tax=Peronosclerospora sorghi TaxID=230839 RepID=A0ACC0WQP6_9STRA|nr:hypothetical protein PsorP6_001527 [Peronosclerospora sorghi]